MKNKNILITGGNAGIGLTTAIALAKLEANVFIVARTIEKGEEAVNHIREKSGNKHVEYFVANLSSQQSIRQLAADIKNKVSVIDVLINNAGGVFPDFKLSDDGLEMTIATNHFAYFLLTNLLLDLIKKSEYARIVNVASDSHYNGKIDFESFTRNKGYFIRSAYENSKLANVLFTIELAERLKGTHVTTNCLQPGLVKTKIGNKGTQWYTDLAWSMLTTLFGLSVEDGAKTSVYLASSPEVRDISGKYFDKCKEKPVSKLAQDTFLRKELWRRSEEWCRLN